MDPKHGRTVASAPSSTANIGPGFDVFGLALDAFHDTVELQVIEEARTIQIEVEGGGGRGGAIPAEPEANSASLALSKMLADYNAAKGVKAKLRKQVPVGYGLGSSGASAAAAVKAFDLLYDLHLDDRTLVKYAAMGEVASAGSVHYDNVAASLLGGFVIVRNDPLNVVRIDPPRDLTLCIAIPKMDVPEKKTEVARSVLPASVSLKQAVSNVANASMMVAGFLLKDVDLIAGAVSDVIVEPARAHLIPGYDEVRRRALGAGALAVTISGAGPSMIAFARDGAQDPEKICRAMGEGFESVGLASSTKSCKPDGGAEILEPKKNKKAQDL